ncbi:MAG: type II/IV secretion system ATPase subunit [Candidatus Micrarchaeia archaeon]
MKTIVDRFMDLLMKSRRVSVKQAAVELKWSEFAIERLGVILEKRGIARVDFPVNPLESIMINFVKEAAPEIVRPKPKITKVRDKYSLNADGVPAEITIYESQEDRSSGYYIEMPTLSPYTRMFVDELKEEVIKEVPIELELVTDVDKAEAIKRMFHKNILEMLNRYGLPESEKTLIGGIILHEMNGLGDIEMLIADDWLEEVIINAASIPIGVYHRKYGWLETNVYVKSEEAIADYSSFIGRKIGRNITTLNPILDAHLISGDRVNATLFPISTRGNTITIRKFARNPWTITNFISPEMNTMSIDMAAMLWQAMQYEMNIIIAGGTASGKTTTLNSLAAFIQPYHRIISIEDTREIMLPQYMWNWIPTVTRVANPEGLGEVSMLDLMVSSLRMRPDRIIVGEIRRSREAEVLFEAMHTGHSVYSTLHADTGFQVLKRITEPPISVPKSEMQAVHLIVVQHRDRRLNLRKTMEISEVVEGAGGEPDLNVLYRWRPKQDKFDLIAEPVKYYQEMNLNTGMTPSEIKEDIADKKIVLKYMLDKKVETLNEVGRLMKIYYTDPDFVLNSAKKGVPKSKMLEG